jgi:hypothetical protein
MRGLRRHLGFVLVAWSAALFGRPSPTSQPAKPPEPKKDDKPGGEIGSTWTFSGDQRCAAS